MEKFELLSDPKELDFFEIVGEQEKNIHIPGYTFYGDNWVYADVSGVSMPLKDFVDGMKQDENFVLTELANAKQYHGDCSEEEIINTINTYWNGQPPQYYLPYDKITIDTPCGHYVAPVPK